jgi:hypothetical protein
VDIYIVGNALRLVVEAEDKKKAPENLSDATHSLYFSMVADLLAK